MWRATALLFVTGLLMGCSDPATESFRSKVGGLTATNGTADLLGPIPLDPIAPGERNQDQVAIGTDGTNFLVVWRDGDRSSADIVGIRVDPSGAPLDPAPFVIGKKFVNVGVNPSVAFDGTNYLVVWGFAPPLGTSREIWGNRVSTDGIALDGDGFLISDGPSTRFFPRVDFNDRDFVVVWTDNRNDVDVWVNRVSSMGQPLDGDGFPLAETVASEAAPDIACQSRQCLVTWQRQGTDFDEIQGKRMDRFGNVLDTVSYPVIVQPNLVRSRVVARAADYVVIGQEGLDADSDIFARPFPRTGLPTDPPVTLFDRVGEDWLGAAVRDGADLIVARRTELEMSLHRFDSSLNPTGAIQQVGFDLRTVAVANNGANVLAGWSRPVDGNGAEAAAFGAVTSSDLSQPFSSARLIGRIPNTSNGHAVYFDGVRYGAIWSDRRSGGFKLFRATFDADEIGEARPILPRSGEQYHPATAAIGNGRLLLWVELADADQPRLWSTVIRGPNTEGTNPISTFVAEDSRPVVATDGTAYLAAWRSSGDSVLAQIIDSAGEGGVGVSIPATGADQFEPHLAWGGENYLLSWTDVASGGTSIKAVRVADDGTLLDETPIEISAIDGTADPFVFWNGASFTVMFRLSEEDATRAAFVRVGSDGAMLDESPGRLELSASHARLSSVATDDEHAVLLYTNADIADGERVHVATMELASHTIVNDEALPDTMPGGSAASIVAGMEDSFGVVAPREVEAPRYSTHLDAFLLDFSRFVELSESSIETDEDTPVTFPIDVVIPVGVEPALTVVSPPSLGTATIDGVDLTYAPSPNENGSDELQVAFDGDGLQAGPVTISIEVVPVDDAPEFVDPTPPDQTVFTTDGESDVTFDVAATDVDGDAVSYRVESAETFATIESQTVRWSAGAPEGTYPLTVVAVANDQEVARQFVIEVGGVPDAPENGNPEGVDNAGCGCATGSSDPIGATLLVVLGLLVLRLRRKRAKQMLTGARTTTSRP